jgi:hypothetical protein
VVHDGQTVTADVTAYRIGTVMTGELNYPQLKNAIEHLYDSRQRTALDSLSVSYNAETGGLTATFSVAKYCSTGTERPIPPPPCPVPV